MTHQPTISFCSLAFRNEPIEAVVERLAGIGYNAVEVFFGHLEKHSPQQLAELRETMRKLGIRPIVLSPYFWLTREPKNTAESMEIATRAVEIARALGIGKIRTFTDAGPDALASENATEAHWAMCVKSLREITAMAPEIDFVVETHNNSLANTLASCKRLIEETAVPNMHFNFQPTTEFMEKGYLECFDALFPWITHMHIAQAGKDKEHWIEEAGEIDFPAVFRHLREKNYQGTFSIEYCWGNIPWERAESAFRFVKGLV